MSRDSSNRISGENIVACQSWSIPNLEGAERVVPSAEKEDRERREEELRRLSEVVGEDIELDENQQWMTVEQLTRISDNARQDGFATGYQEGLDKGFKEGSEKGQTQALAETRQSLERQQQRLDLLLSGLLVPFENHTATLENIFIDAVKVLAEAVLQRELQLDGAHIQQAVQQAVAALPAGEGTITIFLHPDDIAEIKQNALDPKRDWNIHGDETLTPGGCRVITDHSKVDFSIAARLQSAVEILLMAPPTTAEESISSDDGEQLS